jgi:hypothetical protein
VAQDEDSTAVSAANQVAFARRAQRRQRRSSVLLGLAVACWLSGCEPELIVGVWSKSAAGGSSGAGAAGAAQGGFAGGGSGGVANGGAGNGGAPVAGLGGNSGGSDAGDGSAGDIAGAGGEAGGEAGGAGGAAGCDPDALPMGPMTDPIVVPWQTGFENDVCDYVENKGFCYTIGDASYEIVTAPAHSGSSAVAFTVNSAEASAHARCVRQGTLPPDAYYTAWFYVPTSASVTRLWNLFLFQGHDGEDLVRLWDVSIGTTDSGGHTLYLFDHRAGQILRGPETLEIPIGAWFKVEFRLLRADDASGLVSLHQDDVLLVESRRPTDHTTSWGQWYVGNLSEGRSPPDSTIYVDDVSIRAAP